jgi:hypothetical protein
VRARAAAQGALSVALVPADLPLLCLGPPHLLRPGPTVESSNGRAEIGWRALGGGRVRGEVTGIGRTGARYRLWALVAPDSLPTLPGVPGCPAATRLIPQGPLWVLRLPEG